MNKPQVLSLAYAEEIGSFLRSYLEQNKKDCYILGISGGIDSALCAALLKRYQIPFRAYYLPINNSKFDDLCVNELSKKVFFMCQIISLKKQYRLAVKISQKDSERSLTKLAMGNIQARLRMTFLYSQAEKFNGLVIGTDNAAEIYVGYFTKWGDGACDVMPLAYLSKGDVKKLAIRLGVPDEIINRDPSASLWKNQTDEQEMGVSYDEIDAVLRGQEISPESRHRIEQLHANSQHKREPVPKPPHPLVASKFID